MAVRLGRDLPGYLRDPLSPDAASEHVRRALAHRERRFLHALDRLVFRHERSPYLRLLRVAGCERGDLHALVAREGIEGALRVLAAQGVYVTVDELKGRRPIVRGSARFTVSDRDFHSPLNRWRYFEETGGSRGRPQRVGRTLPYLTDLAALVAVFYDAHGIRDPWNVFWFGAMPSWILLHLKLGHSLDAWFQPVQPLPWPARYGLRYIGALAQRAGRSVPAPIHCNLLEPEPIARWIVEHLGQGRPVVLNSPVSSSVRVAAAAAALGCSLDGVTFHGRSEPLTPARQRQIEATGARVVTDYATVELSMLAVPCAATRAPDDLHLGSHRHAVVERERPVYEGGPTVRALAFTTLGIAAPLVALNVETGDVADLDERACACTLGALGLTTHLANVRSFEKLSTEGTTFIRAEVLDILEGLLPDRFGGTALDYQLVEHEAPNGAGTLVLRIHPGVPITDEDAVRTAFLEALARVSAVEAYQTELLRRAQAVTIQRLPPLATGVGKVLPFHLARSAAAVR